MTVQLTTYQPPQPAAPWWELAVCEGADVNTFYPEGKGIRPRDFHVVIEAYCAVCPVVAECLDAALREEDGAPPRQRFGIRGGLTPSERHELAQRQD